MKKFEIIAKAVFVIVLAVLFVWFMASWIDVVAHNTGNGGTDASWNFFKIVFCI